MRIRLSCDIDSVYVCVSPVYVCFVLIFLRVAMLVLNEDTVIMTNMHLKSKKYILRIF